MDLTAFLVRLLKIRATSVLYQDHLILSRKKLGYYIVIIELFLIKYLNI